MPIKEPKKLDRSWVERSKNVLAQGFGSPNSKRWTHFIDGVYPTHTPAKGVSCYLYDVEDNKYLDFICGLGALSLGYTHPKVTEAVHKQLLKGASHSLPTTLTIEVAERLSALIPSMERIRFFKNGDDVARAAVRIARTATGRSLILSDGYHGHSDLFTSLTPPALGITEKFDILPLTPETVSRETPAAVIVEALKLSDGPEYQKWLTDLRLQCREKGIVFILDEIVTGFRVPKWTMANRWGLDPDMVLLGKGVANGFPLSVIGGRKEIMNCGEYFLSTTFSEEAISMAAAKATIDELSSKSFENLMFYGKRFLEKMNALHPEIRFEGWGTRAMLNVENETTALFMQEMCKAGFLFGKAFFYNFAHLEANIEDITLSAAKSAVERIKSGEVKLEGAAPNQSFKR